jgi:3-phosphoglycerate kinase
LNADLTDAFFSYVGLVGVLLQGRPKSGPEDKFRLTPVVPRLSELLGQTVRACAKRTASAPSHRDLSSA